jgi:hypothetical protein
MISLGNYRTAAHGRRLRFLGRVAVLLSAACGSDDATQPMTAQNPETTAGAPSAPAGGSAPAAAGSSAAGRGAAASAGRDSSPTTMTPTMSGTAGATPPAAGGAGSTAMMEPVAGGEAPADPTAPMGEYDDPSGTSEFVPVAEGDVAAECKMDIEALKSTGLSHNFAVFRYGKLCYEQGRDSATQVFSATKSLGGIVTASVAYLTKDVPSTGPGTGTFNDYDMANDWGLAGYRQGMQLAYLMSMATGSLGLEWGQRSFSYDTVGSSGLNAMGNVANRALQQDSSLGVANTRAAGERLFEKLGMTNAYWDGVGYGTGATLTLRDMGKLFQVMIHNGVYNKERLIGTDWVYRMTHPALEDANTSYGEFFWLNHRGNAAGIGGDIGSGSNSADGDPCAPAAFWQRYPHKVSDAPDCQATVPGAKCEQKYDVGVFSAQGLGGQFIIGHPGLDLVLAIKDFSGMNGPMGFWEKIRPAVVALDPMYMGDEAAFCAAYGAGDYAPDLKVQPTQPPDPP